MSINNNFLNKYTSYQITNFSFLVALFLILAYSSLFGVSDLKYPISCAFKDITGINCPSCGMSRSFSAALNGDFNSAYSYNNKGVLIFVFVVFQFFMRLAGLVLAYKKRVTPVIIKLDVTLSVIFFAISFFPLLLDWISFINQII